ncbi:MAG: hypothetical protein PHG25_03620 [Candidatus Pacebacteria bacterium]|nr:hypothetical protein [Candidatus Paceibacterota bacterium]
MKPITYDEPSRIQELCQYLEQFRWFRMLDIELCYARNVAFRLWWHGLWVRSKIGHPSTGFDRQILEWYKKEFVSIWDIGMVTPYEINLIRRRREFDARFPHYRPVEPEYPIKFFRTNIGYS